MSFEFSCQVCGRELKADERAIGRKVRCPDCATLLIIPDPNAGDEVEEETEHAASLPVKPDAPPKPSQRPRPTPPPEEESDLGATAEMDPLDLPSPTPQQRPASPPRPGPPPQPSPQEPSRKSRRSRRNQTAPESQNPRQPTAPAPAPSTRPENTPSHFDPAAYTPTQPSSAKPQPATPPSEFIPHTSAFPSPSSEFSIQNSALPPTPRSALRTPHSPPEPPLFPPYRAESEDLIDMTAMVDIVFFLLIFFLVTSLQALEAVMNMPTPQSGEAGVTAGKSVADFENDPNYITVRIEDDDSIWVGDKQVFNDQELTKELRTARQESDAARSLLVIGDADASHGTAVRVFDAGAAANVSSISLIVQEKGEGGR